MTAPEVQPRLTRHPDGVTAVDTEYVRPGMAAAHLIAEPGRAAFVDVGTNYSVPYLLAALEVLGIERHAVEYVFLTHVHLDHAGGAGRLLQALPEARAVIHPRGIAHMADPARLIAASIAVYGEALYRRLYGELVPIPTERILPAEDGATVRLGARELTLIHTPGHALHHYCLYDAQHASVFTGDTFGLSYRELDTAAGAFVVPTTTPTQFDPEQLVSSIDKLMARAPRAAYLMHYSRITGLARAADSLRTQIGEFVAIARRRAADAHRQAAIRADMRALWLRLARAHGITASETELEEILGKDLDLNAQGLVAWLERQAAVPRERTPGAPG